MTKIELGKITVIKSGYLVKDMSERESGTEAALIQLKDIDADNNIVTGSLNRAILPVSHDYYLRKGDILFKAKSLRPGAVFIGQEMERVVATAQFFVIRTIADEALPEYLAWYLNQKQAQEYFARYAEGSSLKIINKKTLIEFEAEIPDIAVQENIIRINKLMAKERILASEIRQKKEKALSALLCRAAKNS